MARPPLFQPTTDEQLANARKHLTADEAKWLDTHGDAKPRAWPSRSEQRAHSEKMAVKRSILARGYDRYYKAAVAENEARRAREAAEATAEDAASRPAPVTGYDAFLREYHPYLFEPTTTDHRPTPERYMPDPPINPADADALATRARELADKALVEPTEGNKYQALVADAEAKKARASARLDAETKAATLAVEEAVRKAGSDVARRERAKAKAIAARAEDLGKAHDDFAAADLALDRAYIETATAAKLAAHRIESRKRQIAADEAKALNDPQAMGNPYYRPPASLADWQFAALSPELKAKAMADGVKVYSDPPPAFTADDVRAVLRSRGSADRAVVTRAELAAMSPEDAMRASQSAIIVE